MTRTLAALVLFAVVLALGPWTTARSAEDPPSAGTCLVCKDEHTAVCPVCAGKKRVVVDCGACDGKGKSRCPVRTRVAESGPSAASYEKVFGHDGTQRVCPAVYCVDGTIRWEGGKSATCKLCSGSGRTRCADCQSSGSACNACAGKGTVEGPCIDCAGAGKIPCVLCAERYPSCQRCEGRSRVACPQFEGSKTGPGPCTECSGRGTQVCSKCSGALKMACGGCDATGRQRMVFSDGTAASSTKCKTCDARGVTSCTTCTKGFESCDDCGGTKVMDLECRACNGTSELPCRACGPAGFFAAEAFAVQFAKQESSPAAKATAIALYRKALERAQRPQLTAARIGEMSSKKDKVPSPPGAGADAAAVKAYSEAVKTYVTIVYEQVRRVRAATSVVEAAKACAQRCEKALARLGAPAK